MKGTAQTPTGDHPLNRGARIAGRYEIREHLRDDAYAFELLAEDREEKRDVLLRVLRRGLVEQTRRDGVALTLSQNLGIGGRFLPGLLDAGCDGPWLFLTEPLPPGARLEDVIQERRAEGKTFSSAEVLPVVNHLDAALSALNAPLRHGDLRARHIWVAPDGLVLTGPFLIPALPRGSVAAAVAGNEELRRHSAPELKDGRSNATSDLYGVGIIALEMLSGMSLGPVDPATSELKGLEEALDKVPDEADEPLRELLEPNPANRSRTLDRLRKALAQDAGLALNELDPEPFRAPRRASQRPDQNDNEPTMVGPAPGAEDHREMPTAPLRPLSQSEATQVLQAPLALQEAPSESQVAEDGRGGDTEIPDAITEVSGKAQPLGAPKVPKLDLSKLGLGSLGSKPNKPAKGSFALPAPKDIQPKGDDLWAKPSVSKPETPDPAEEPEDAEEVPEVAEAKPRLEVQDEPGDAKATIEDAAAENASIKAAIEKAKAKALEEAWQTPDSGVPLDPSESAEPAPGGTMELALDDIEEDAVEAASQDVAGDDGFVVPLDPSVPATARPGGTMELELDDIEEGSEGNAEDAPKDPTNPAELEAADSVPLTPSPHEARRLLLGEGVRPDDLAAMNRSPVPDGIKGIPKPRKPSAPPAKTPESALFDDGSAGHHDGIVADGERTQEVPSYVRAPRIDPTTQPAARRHVSRQPRIPYTLVLIGAALLFGIIILASAVRYREIQDEEQRRQEVQERFEQLHRGTP